MIHCSDMHWRPKSIQRFASLGYVNGNQRTLLDGILVSYPDTDSIAMYRSFGPLVIGLVLYLPASPVDIKISITTGNELVIKIKLD